MADGKAGPPLGNQNAAKSKPFLAMLNKILTDETLNKPEQQRRLWKAGNKLLDLAAKGEEWAVKELANRLDGKPKQQVELSDPEGRALNFFDAGALRHMDPSKVEQLKELLKEASKT